MNIESITNNFHFLRPEYLWLFSLIVIFVMLKSLIKSLRKRFANLNNNYKAWRDVCAPGILNFLYKTNNNNPNKLSNNILHYIIWSLMIFALAGPAWDKKEIPLYQNQNSWVIALSLSDSMEKTDLSPSRSQRAKYKIKDFVNYLQDEQLGLIVFTNAAYEIIPLTTDKKTILHILPSIDPLIMPEKGDDVNAALVKAKDLINNLNLKSSNILLLTDSNANSQSLLTAKELKNNNIAVYTINFNPELNHLNNSLEELSKLSNGIYYNITNTDKDLKDILKHAKFRYNAIYEKNDQLEKTQVWYDMGPWLLLFILPFFAWLLFVPSFTKNKLGNLSVLLALTLLGLVVPYPKTYADTNSLNNDSSFFTNITESKLWQKLWYNEQQIAAKNLTQNKNADQINPDIFQNSKWKAAAAYKNQKYDLSENLLKSEHDLTSNYNSANSLAKQGKLPEAIEQYNQILKKDPKHTDAKFNKELLEKYLQQQQQNQNQNQKQDQKNDQKQQSEQQNQQSQQQDQQQQSQQQDQQSPQKQAGKQQQDNKDEQLQKNKEQAKADSNKTEQQKQEQEQESQQAQTKAASKSNKTDEELNKWLDKIPDNPANYLRNQLLYEYWQKRQTNNF